MFGISGGFVIFFVLLSLINIEGVAEGISAGFAWTAATLGSYFQLLLLGSLTAVVLAYWHYDRGMPLQPRTLLYPVLGERLMRGWVGGVADACCVIAVVAGTVGPIGFFATQVSFGLHELFGFGQGYGAQLTILIVLGLVYVTSAATGIHRGIHSQLNGEIDLTEALTNFQFDVATLTVAQALPGGVWMAVAILLLTTIFVATTGDSMSYAIAVVCTGHDQPHVALRIFWGITMATMAAILLYMGAGQISVLQQFIVITAIPVSLLLLPSLWLGPQAAYAMARQQQLISPKQ